MKKLFTLFLLMTIFIPVTNVNALSLTPSNFKDSIYTWCPVSYEIQIDNNLSEAANVSASYSDVPAFLLARDEVSGAKTGIEDWISISDDQTRIAANQKKSIEVAIDIPNTVESGKYYGMVMFTDKNSFIGAEIGHTLSLSVENEKVSGAKTLQLIELDFNYFSLFKQSGLISITRENISEAPADVAEPAVLEVKNMFGKTVSTFSSEEPEDSVVCPGNTMKNSFDWNLGLFSFGFYTFSLSEVDVINSEANERVFISSPLTVAIIIILFFGIVALIRRIFK